MNRLKGIVIKKVAECGGQTRPDVGLALAAFTSASAALLSSQSSSVASALHSVAGLLP